MPNCAFRYRFQTDFAVVTMWCGIALQCSATNAQTNRSPTTSGSEDVWVVTKPVISMWCDTHRLCRVETTIHQRVADLPAAGNPRHGRPRMLYHLQNGSKRFATAIIPLKSSTASLPSQFFAKRIPIIPLGISTTVLPPQPDIAGT
jgi:hypothetical protein